MLLQVQFPTTVRYPGVGAGAAPRSSCRDRRSGRGSSASKHECRALCGHGRRRLRRDMLARVYAARRPFRRATLVRPARPDRLRRDLARGPRRSVAPTPARRRTSRHGVPPTKLLTIRCFVSWSATRRRRTPVGAAGRCHLRNWRRHARMHRAPRACFQRARAAAAPPSTAPLSALLSGGTVFLRSMRATEHAQERVVRVQGGRVHSGRHDSLEGPISHVFYQETSVSSLRGVVRWYVVPPEILERGHQGGVLRVFI